MDYRTPSDIDALEGATAAEATDMRVPEAGTQTMGRGWVEVICGSMFSGKSEELIRRLRRAEIGR